MSDPEPSGVGSSEFMGYRIVVSHVPFVEQQHHSFLERLLAAGSSWGVQDDLWEWTVYEGATPLATDMELSELAATESARYWVGSNRALSSGLRTVSLNIAGLVSR